MRVRYLAVLSLSVVVFGCPVEEPPPPRGTPIGTIVGEVFDTSGEPLGGATVEVYGTPATVVTEAGKDFVLGAVPLGTHTLNITHGELGKARRLEVRVAEPFQTVFLDEEDTTLGAAATLRGAVSVSDGSPVGAIAFLVGGNGNQQAPVGDDGSFVLRSMPTGKVQIGVSKVGYDTAVKEVELDEGDNELDDLALAPASAGDLCINGVVKRVESTDHRGIAVLVNGGEHVAATNREGRYEVCGLSPGLLSIKAQAAGFKTTELAQVALTASGEAHGLVPAWLSPGSDEPTVSDVDVEARGLRVRIDNPLSGAVFEAGSEIAFVAAGEDRGAALPGSALSWTRAPADDPEASPIPMGSGGVLTVSDLPVGVHVVTAVATAADGAKSGPANVVVTVEDFRYGLSVAIVEPEAAATTVVEGAPIAFRAVADTSREDGSVVVDPTTDVSWTYRPANDPAATPAPLVDDDAGNNVGAEIQSAALPLGDWLVSAHVATSESPSVASVEKRVTVTPLVPQFDVDVLVGEGTDAVELAPGEYELVMYVGQVRELAISVLHPTLGQLADTATWSSDTGVAFAGPVAALDQLPAGTHVFTIAVQGSGGEATTFTLTVEVLPFTFTVDIVAPRLVGDDPDALDPPPYFTNDGVPLRATFSHPFQTAFLTSQARWFHVVDDETQVPVASGLVSRSFSLPPGQGVLRFELTDAAGNVASATTEYVLQAITFDVAFVEPSAGVDVLEGEPITASVAYSHTLVSGGDIDESALEVRYFSSINGQLADDTGKDVFSVDDRPALVGLTFGQHTLTVSVRDGQGRIASARRPVVVRSPGVAATLTSPTPGLVIFPGVTDVRFAAQVTFDPSVQPLFTWRMDGQEFGSDWDDYGADPTDPARADVSLGVFDSAAVSGPFADPRWKDTDTQHEVELFVRLPEIDAQYGGACVNVPQKAVCIQLTVDVVLGDPDVCTGGAVSRTIGAGEPEVWSGVKRLNCRVDVESGGELQVLPGTRVVVDPASDHGIQVENGTLVVGQLAAAPVVFEVQGASAAANAWEGIQLLPTNASAPTHLELYNTIIRHTDYALTTNGSYTDSADHTARLRDVTFEDVFGAWSGFCPDEASGVVVRGASDYAIDEGGGLKCRSGRVLAGLVVEDARGGVRVTGVGEAVVEGAVMRRLSENAVYTSDSDVERVVVRDSLFEDIGSHNTNDAVLYSSSYCPILEVYGNTVRRATQGVFKSGCSYTVAPHVRTRVARNVFEDVRRAVYDSSTNSGSVLVQLNSIRGSATFFEVTGAGSDVEAQGNFLGGAGDIGTPGAVLLTTPPGTLPNLPRVHDWFDAVGNDRVVRASNVLPSAVASPGELPIAFIREPQRTRPYKVDEGACLPLLAEAPFADVEVLQPGATSSGAHDAACWWYRLDDAAAPDEGRTALPFDADGCADASALPPGDHAILLECVHEDGGRVDRHATTVRVDNSAWLGALTKAVTTWDGVVELAGDVTVPAGKTLVVNPGAEVRIRTIDALRMKRNVDYPQGNEGQANVAFGLREKIDIFVDGTLIVGSADGAEATLRSAAALQAKSLWGGIRADKGAVVTLENARISGAAIATHGTFDPMDSNTAPLVDYLGVTVSDSLYGHRGTCPSTFTRVAMTGVERLIIDGYCPGSFTISKSTFTDVGTADLDTGLIMVSSYPDASLGSQLIVEDVLIDRGWGNRRSGLVWMPSGNRFTQVVVNDTELIDMGYLVSHTHSYAGESHTLHFDGVRMSNFHRLFQGTSQHDVIGVTNSTFVDGETLFESGRDARIMNVTDNWIERVSFPFLNVGFGSEVETLTFTGNQVIDAENVFEMRMAGSTNDVFSPVITHNNFVGTTGFVWKLRSDNMASQDTNADLTDNWWGTSVESEIQALIDDPQTDGAGPDYSGYASAPHALTAPPP